MPPVPEITRRGRPPGEVTPESLIRAELIAHLRLYKRTREIVERRLDAETMDADELGKFMDLLRKGIVEMAKPFVANAKPENAKVEESEDTEQILARLISGQAQR